MDSMRINPNARAVLGQSRISPARKTFEDYKELQTQELGGRKQEVSRLFQGKEIASRSMVWRALGQVISHLCEDPSQAKRVLDRMRAGMLGYFASHPGASQTDFEVFCQAKMKELIPGFDERLSRKLLGDAKDPHSGRSGLIFSQIRPFIVGERVLDVGAGDGQVGLLVALQMGKGVQLVDVIDYNRTLLPLALYDGLRLPFDDNAFDTSIVSVVFHHADRPLKVLSEAIRVSARRLVVIESVYFDEEHRKLNVVLDWFYNRVLHEGVNCPFNFQTPLAWEDTFRQNGTRISASVDLGIEQPLVPEYHWLYALDVGG